MYTALSFAAYKNHPECFKLIYKHALIHNLPGPAQVGDLRKESDIETQEMRSSALKIWVNMPTDERFTALHFVSYHGNLELIQILVNDMSADIEFKNTYGANVLHIAAQGNQPLPIYFFVKKKHMDISEADNRGSTPLHWACYSKSEEALIYILACNPNLEATDQNGLTPLHLAIKSVPDLDSTRPVRSLLLKGSSRDAVTHQNQTCHDLIKDDWPQNLKNELEGMLEEPKYIECCLRKVPLKPI